MISLLIYAVMYFLFAQPPDDMVHIHEWGVIQLDHEYQSAVGASPGNLDSNGNLQPMEIMSVEAPLVWFHGAECTGTLTVTANSGFVTTAVPWYDGVYVEEETLQEMASQTVTWLDLSISSRESICSLNFQPDGDYEVEYQRFYLGLGSI